MSDSPRKILMITPFFSPNIGGSETFLDDLIEYLNEKDEFVDVITYQPLTTQVNAPFVEKKKNRIFRIYWPKFNLFYKLENRPPLQLLYLSTGILCFACFYFIFGQARKIRSVNCHGLAAAFVGYFLSFFYRKNYVLTFHTNYRFKKGALQTRVVIKIMARFNWVLALSEKCKKNLVEIGIPQEKIEVFYNWVDEKKFNIKDKILSRTKIGWEKNGFHALFIGRFSEEKGIFDLIKSIPYIDKSIHLDIIGGGKKEKIVVNASKKFTNLKYYGRKKQDDLVDYLNAADILIYAPADEDYLGRVAILALSTGLPIMIGDESCYLGNKRKVTLEIPEDVGRKFKNTPIGFAKDLNLIYKESIGEFNQKSCREYAQKFYSRTVNGDIISSKLINQSKIC